MRLVDFGTNPVPFPSPLLPPLPILRQAGTMESMFFLRRLHQNIASTFEGFSLPFYIIAGNVRTRPAEGQKVGQVFRVFRVIRGCSGGEVWGGVFWAAFSHFDLPHSALKRMGFGEVGFWGRKGAKMLNTPKNLVHTATVEQRSTPNQMQEHI